jgi:hypothetical protein
VTVTREEFDVLRIEVEAIRRIVSRDHAPRLAAVENAVDEFRGTMTETRVEVRALGNQVGRLTDLVTPVAMALPRVERNVARLVEILEPRTVVVEGG